MNGLEGKRMGNGNRKIENGEVHKFIQNAEDTKLGNVRDGKRKEGRKLKRWKRTT